MEVVGSRLVCYYSTSYKPLLRTTNDSLSLSPCTRPERGWGVREVLLLLAHSVSSRLLISFQGENSHIHTHCFPIFQPPPSSPQTSCATSRRSSRPSARSWTRPSQRCPDTEQRQQQQEKSHHPPRDFRHHRYYYYYILSFRLFSQVSIFFLLCLFEFLFEGEKRCTMRASRNVQSRYKRIYVYSLVCVLYVGN